MAPLLKRSAFVLLALFPVLLAGEWITAPRPLQENHDYTGLDYIAKIRSDKENFTRVLYYLTGPGADMDPVGVFRVNQETGYVRIYSVLDREKIPFYHLKGVAKFTDGTYAEKDIDLNITVVDVNDNPPVIAAHQVGSVSESSSSGTLVMKVIATDADQENTLHSQISYSIMEQSSTVGMFYIIPETGEVRVRQNTLDREKQDTYKLTIKACDLNGRPGAYTGTGVIEIKILDINDNVPVLEHESYEGSVEENTINVEVLRIKAVDLDLIYTENWLAVFEIISGNEGGYFTITTDAETNEGIIMIHKALDYEELKELNLQVSLSNKAEYNFGSSSITGSIVDKSYSIKINVINQKEGPRFQPSVKVVTLSEDQTSISLNSVIINYAAIDTDTQLIATDVRYAKVYDLDNWLIIDEKTADIRLNKLPDRESEFLINGTYYAKIICITNEQPSKTATGTIAIQVEDFNDHCPALTSTTQTMCFEDQVIYVTAIDKDEFPNSAPFQFNEIKADGKAKWTVEPFNSTTVILRDNANLWPGSYKVELEIRDQQGKMCADVQIMTVIVCTCDENTKSCKSRSASTAAFGAAGVLLLLLGLLLLLLVPLLLLFCLCGGAAAIGDFKDIPSDTKQQLISYHTEGQGEDKEIPLLLPSVEVDGGRVNAKDINTLRGRRYLGGLVDLGGASGGANLRAEDMHMYNYYRYSSGQEDMEFMKTGMMGGQDMNLSHYRGGVFDGMALSDEFLWEYYSAKSNHAAQQSQEKDGLLIYDYEGRESLAGSVGCCSLLENDDDLAFLNDLGPKFKTLAEICQGSTLLTESVDSGDSVPRVRPVSPIRPSTSAHTHVHSHTETMRDRDRISVSTLDASKVEAESSTFIQEERVNERAQGSAAAQNLYVKENVVIPSQTLLIQQPAMYYAATPMYVVESKPQMMLVTGGTQQAVGQVGLSPGLMQVGGIQASQGVVLVERQVETGQVTGQVVQGLSPGTRSREVVMGENGLSGGEQGVHLSQGFVQTGQESAQKKIKVTSQGRSVKAQTVSQGSHSSTGSSDDFTLTATPKLQGSQRVVVQHKKVSVTERNIESSSRA
ncbi:desmoglein-2-like protein [Pholidichthys leucotaenia]